MEDGDCKLYARMDEKLQNEYVATIVNEWIRMHAEFTRT